MALQLLSTVLALTLVICLTEAQEQSSNEPFPLTPAFASHVIARSPDDSYSCALPEEQQQMSNMLQQFLEDEVVDRLPPCNLELTANCPANNCSELFDLVQDGIAHVSNYYWLQAPNGEVNEVYCNRDTGEAEYSSCSQVYELGLPSGEYTIRSSGGSPVTVYCDMDREECGGGVWTRVASYDYSDPNTSCPGDWEQITTPVRGCQRSISVGCKSAVFPTGELPYSRVCGRVLAIQFSGPPAFRIVHQNPSPPRTIDDHYVDGVSITYGNPRAHIWTFAGYPADDYSVVEALCPCSQPSLNVPAPPSFIGDNYFCDTGSETCCVDQYYPEDPLFDGQGCEGESTCCSFNNPPWFSTSLPQTTSEDIEVRECGSGDYSKTLITNLDLYIRNTI